VGIREGSPKRFRRRHGSRRSLARSIRKEKTGKRSANADRDDGPARERIGGSYGCVPARRNQLCCRNRSCSLSLKEARVLSTLPTREGAGNAWAGASHVGKTVRRRKTSGGSSAGRKAADHQLTAAKSVGIGGRFETASPSKEVGAHCAAQAAWRGARTQTDERHLGSSRACTFTRARRKQPRSSGEGKPFTAQTGLRCRSEDPEGDGMSEANSYPERTKRANNPRAFRTSR